MRILEVRRHAHRKHGGGSQLSQEGVAAARKLGANLGPFAVVATSVSPRSRETAIAMGFAVDQMIEPLFSDDESAAEIESAGLDFTKPLMPHLGRLMARKGSTWHYGRAIFDLWRDLIMSLPDGASALVISHSGVIELGLIATFPEADHTSWGKSFAPLEGARLTFEGEPARFTKIELLRNS